MSDYVESATVNGVFVRNGSSTGYAEKTESDAVPASSPYVIELEEVIHESSTPSGEIDGVAANLVPWSFAPASGEIAVDRPRGLLKFNSADAGLDWEFTYTPAGTRLSAGKIDALVDPDNHTHDDRYYTESEVDTLLAGVVVGEVNLSVEDLDDVTLTSVADNDVLTYDSGTATWVNQAPTAGSLAVDDLTDVALVTPQDDDILIYDSGQWINRAATDSLNPSLDALTDATITSPADDQILEYNGTAWVNGRKITSGTTEPASPATGDIWLDTN